MKIYIRLLLAFLLPLSALAQDPIFTQFHNVPEAFNPAFTASANTWNGGLLHRRQWPYEDRQIDTQFAFASNLVTDEIGLGITVQNHYEEFTGYKYIKFNGAVSYTLEVSYDWRIRFGIEGGYGQKDFGFGGLLLEDQINVGTGAIEGPTIDPSAMRANKIDFMDMSAGIFADNEESWVGVSLRHLTRPDIAFLENNNVPLEMFLSVHGGYFFDITGLPTFLTSEESTLLVLANYMRQAQYNRLDVGTLMDYGMFSIGVFSSVNLERTSANSHFLSSVNPVGTFNFSEFKFGYSYDINTSNIGRTGGVHELSLVWQSSRQCSECDNYKVRLKRNGVAGYAKS